MTNRTVLIVDDSKIAGVALGRVLEQHGLTVELAESGQDCLDYLRRNIPPGAIFLDHMMPGMDGFDVLRAVKGNTQTTAIPIIMYTSRDGQAYMGEAMALGAYDVLSKPIKVIDLLRILRRLGLLEDTPALRPATAASSEPAAANSETTNPAPATKATHAEGDVATLLEQQRALWRRDLAEGLESMAERLGRRGGKRPASGFLGEPNRWHVALYIALLIIPLLWTIGLYRATSTPVAAPISNATGIPSPSAVVASRPNDVRSDMLLEMAAWAANLNGQYEYNRAPLDDTRLQMLREMLMRLSAANFRGTVRIDTHVGEFCLVRGENGEWRLPGDDSPKDKCEFLNLATEQFVALGRRQSAAFAGFLQNSSLATGDTVKVQIVSHGRSQPLLEYPIFSNIQTAGEWNRVARLNNRVEFTFIPQESVATAR